MRSKSRSVYVIADGDMVKIGIAAFPPKRLAQMQTGSSRRLRLINSFRLPYKLAEIVEDLCHAELAEFRSAGEWFKIDPATAWACVQRHGSAVVKKAQEISAAERIRVENELITALEQLNTTS